MSKNREPGEISHDFARAASGTAPRHETGDLSREFNYAAEPPGSPPNTPSPDHDQEPPEGPTLGPIGGSMSSEQQRESRLAEMKQSLSEQFRRAAKEKANKPHLER